jgi:hypothetical protein
MTLPVVHTIPHVHEGLLGKRRRAVIRGSTVCGGLEAARPLLADRLGEAGNET